MGGAGLDLSSVWREAEKRGGGREGGKGGGGEEGVGFRRVVFLEARCSCPSFELPNLAS